jgi:hypothetical protein
MKALRTTGLALSLGALLATACKKGGEAPPKPVTDAPVAFEVTKVASAESLEVRAYNFSDVTVAGYDLVIRYQDAGGAVLKTDVGTPFEKDFARWSISGLSYKCPTHQWCSFKLDHLKVPAGAAKAEILATRVRALAKDGIMFEEKPVFELPFDTKWPTGPAASK